MNVKKAGKTIFVASTLLLLLMLAIGSMMSFAENRASSSYTLTIVKKLDFTGVPAENIPSSLSDLSYNFDITGVQGVDPPNAINEKVTIDNFTKIDDSHAEGSATITLGTSSAVSVIELTNTLDSDLIGYGVSGTSYVSHMHANNGYAEVTLSKETNWLTITPSTPADGTNAIERIYRVTGPGFSEYYRITDGQSKRLENLAPGNYIIEAVKAPDGFSVELRNPTITVASGAVDTAKTTIKINGNSGTVTVTAGGTSGDGQIHHFVAEKVDDSSFKEEFSLASGETYTRDHLTKGEYTLSARTFEGTPAFSVEVTSQPKKVSSGSSTYTNPKKGSLPSFSLTGDLSETDFVKMSVSNVKPTSAQKNYQIQIKTTAESMLKKNSTTGKYEKTGLNYLNSYSTNNPIPSDSFRLPVGPGNRFNFGFRSVNPDPFTVTSYKLNWTVYRPYSTNTIDSTSGEKKVVTVYDDGYVDSPWIEISKTPDTDPTIQEHIKYNFTITSQDTGAEYTVTLGGKDGVWRQKLELPAGKYTVEQKMIQKDSSAFTVSVEDKQYTTDKKSSITASVLGSGSTISLKKPADPDNKDPDRLYRQYSFKITGPSFPNGVDVSLAVNEIKKLRELLSDKNIAVPGAGGGYDPGDYTITPIDDNYVGFDLDYSDSCTVAIVGSPATVTITNTYSEVKGSYRVVHEYYADDSMDKASLDGISEISQFAAPVFEKYTHDNVTRVPTFTSDAGTYIYEYKAFAYGNYGTYEPTAKTVSGNTPEVVLNTVNPEENPDASGNDPVDEPPDMQDSDDIIFDGQNPETENTDGQKPGTVAPGDLNSGTEISDGQNPGTETPDGQNPDGKNPDISDSGGQSPDPSAENSGGQDTNTIDSSSQNLSNGETSGIQEPDINDADNGSSEEINSIAELSVMGSSATEKFYAGIAGGRNSALECSDNNIVRCWNPGNRKPVVKTSANRVPSVRNAVAENSDGQKSDDTPPGTDTLSGQSPDTNAPADTTFDEIDLSDGNPNGQTPDGQNPNGTASDSEDGSNKKLDEELPDEQNPIEISSDETLSGNDIQTAVEPLAYTLAAENGNFTDDGTYIEDPDNKTGIEATENGDKIIIIKYVRRNIVTTGSYKVVHRYYLRDSNGDHLEGTVTDPDATGLPLDYTIKYTAEKNVQQKPRYSPTDSSITHTYTFDSAVYGPYKDGSGNDATHEAYQPASGKDCVYSTPNGDEVIVLRYVRTVSYNVVHEYYLRTPVEDTGNGSSPDITPPTPGSETGGETYTVGSVNSRSGDTEEEGRDDGSGDSEEDNGGDDGGGDTEVNYQYDYEGRTRISTITGNLNETYTEARVDRIVGFRPQSAPTEYRYTPYAYSYGKLATGSDRGYTEDSSMPNAIATTDGDQVIIIKYYRDLTSTPEPEPTSPDPGPNPGGGRDHDPDPDPEPELIPEPEPEPELPTELPDPNDPDSPDKITIMEDGVPKTYVKVWDPRIDEWVYIPEEDVPLWGFPLTGDNSHLGLWLILSGASFAGILFLWTGRDKEISRKKKD